jgi:hypothetical protein
MQIFGTTKKNHVLLSKNTKRGKPKKRSIGQGREWTYNCKIGQSSSKCDDDERKKGTRAATTTTTNTQFPKLLYVLFQYTRRSLPNYLHTQACSMEEDAS